MPSQVWGRDPQEAYEEPYEYGIQEQFVREAKAVLTRLYRLLNSRTREYSISDTSCKKAVWLLAMDALDSLRDCLSALVRREHRVAGKMFRDIVESLDLAGLFHAGSPRSVVLLEKWFADEVVLHSEYRDYVKRTYGSEYADGLKRHYKSLSRFTHRSYRVIMNGYLCGARGRLWHDRSGELDTSDERGNEFFVLPHTLASYYAVLANLLIEFADDLSKLELVTTQQVQEAFASSLETETVPRTFMPRRWLAERMRSGTAKV